MPNHTTRNRPMVALCAALALSGGCATMVLGPKHLVGSEVIDEQRSVGRYISVRGEVQRQDDHVNVFAVRQCEQRAQLTRTIEYTYAQDRDIEASDPRPTFLLAGVGALALGSYLYLNADHLAEESKQDALKKGEKEYTGAGATRTAGGAFAGVGVIALLVVIVDTVRASTSETWTETKTDQKWASGPLAYCGEAPLPGAVVMARTDNDATELGATDQTGRLELDAEDLRGKLRGQHAKLVVSDTNVGEWVQ